MNRPTRLVAGAVFATVLAFAQRPGGGPGDGSPPDPQAMLERRISFLAKSLNLTDDQKAKAATIYTDAQAAGQNARTSLQNTHTSLTEAVKKNDTVAIDQLSATVGTLTGQLMATERKADAAFYSLLTDEQKAKFDSRGGMGGGGGMGFGRPRPFGGPGGPPPQP